MSSLEVIVRPFATQEVAFPRRYVLPNQRPTPPVRLQWGRNGGGKTMGASVSVNVSFYLDQQIVEKNQ